MEPVAAGTPIRMAALLIGVNAGPLITPWASLATLLWASRWRAADLPVTWLTFTARASSSSPPCSPPPPPHYSSPTNTNPDSKAERRSKRTDSARC